LAKRISSAAGFEAAILQAVKENINETLAGEVTDISKRIIQESIDTVVYGAYSPKHYGRRMDGGLRGEGGLSPSVGDMKLTIEHDVVGNPYKRTFNGGSVSYEPWPDSPHQVSDLSGMIIQGYSHPVGGPYSASRPYMDYAEEQAVNNGEIKAAIIKGLSNIGLK